MDDSRDERILRRMDRFESDWSQFLSRARRIRDREGSRCLLETCDEYVAKHSLFLNLNAVYGLDEFSADNIFYRSLRGDVHPNAPHRSFEERLRPIQRSGISWYAAPERNEYLQKRLEQYGTLLKEVAFYCFEKSELAVIGESMSSPRKTPALVPLSIRFNNSDSKITLTNNSSAFIFWSIGGTEETDGQQVSVQPADGGIYPHESVLLTIVPAVVQSAQLILKTESGLTLPIFLSHTDP